MFSGESENKGFFFFFSFPVYQTLSCMHVGLELFRHHRGLEPDLGRNEKEDELRFTESEANS